MVTPATPFSTGLDTVPPPQISPLRADSGQESLSLKQFPVGRLHPQWILPHPSLVPSFSLPRSLHRFPQCVWAGVGDWRLALRDLLPLTELLLGRNVRALPTQDPTYGVQRHQVPRQQ